MSSIIKILIGIMCVSPLMLAQEQSGDIHLDVLFHRQEKTVQITLRNAGHRTYLLSMGGLCGPYGSPDLHLSARGEGLGDSALYLAYGVNPTGMPCGGPDPWVVVLTEGAEYGFTFPLTHLRLIKHFRTSLDEVPNKRWSLTVKYTGHVSSEYRARWKLIHQSVPADTVLAQQIPFWTGTLSATVSSQP